jgi:hypothetical protein
VTVDPAPLPRGKDELAPDPLGLETFARLEGLIGQETALLKIPAKDRDREQNERLGSIADELDRLWDLLRRRAERLGRPAHSG